MEFVMGVLILLALGLIIATALIDDEDLALVRALIGIFIFVLGISVCVIVTNINNKPTTKQPKYKQEIVYSLKDGKYLPTDTLYIEIK